MIVTLERLIISLLTGEQVQEVVPVVVEWWRVTFECGGKKAHEMKKVVYFSIIITLSASSVSLRGPAYWEREASATYTVLV
jgi:hypothetical protein